MQQQQQQNQQLFLHCQNPELDKLNVILKRRYEALKSRKGRSGTIIFFCATTSRSIILLLYV